MKTQSEENVLERSGSRIQILVDETLGWTGFSNRFYFPGIKHLVTPAH